MSYATVEFIQEEFKNVTFDSSSAVTDDRVARFITEEEAKINARIGQIYVTPIDPTKSPNSQLILQGISIAMVSNRVKEILEVKSDSDDTNQSSKKETGKSPYDLIEDIVNRSMPLPDAVLLSTVNGATSYDSSSADPTAKNVFRKGTNRYGGSNQW